MSNIPELLTISEAAELLKVSKASLRRWSSSGLLPCYRVGDRSERRFKRADLLAFVTGEKGAASLLESTLEDSVPVPTVSPRNTARNTESRGFRKHICTFYKNPREQWQLFREHFLEHLSIGARVVYLYHGDGNRVINWIIGEGLDVEALQKNRQLVLLSTTDTYSIGGFFNTARMLEFWRNLAAEAEHDGIKRLLFTGEMGWANTNLPGHEQLVPYEEELEHMLQLYPHITVVCQYPVYQISGATVYDNLCCHTHVQLADRLASTFSPLP